MGQCSGGPAVPGGTPVIARGTEGSRRMQGEANRGGQNNGGGVLGFESSSSLASEREIFE